MKSTSDFINTVDFNQFEARIDGIFDELRHNYDSKGTLNPQAICTTKEMIEQFKQSLHCAFKGLV